MSKEYIFTVEVDGKNVLWKCIVDEKQVITFEGDRESERLTITNPERKPEMVQIEAEVKLYDDVLPFRLENGVPYIQLEGEWTASDTTEEENLQSEIRSAKKQIYLVLGIGVIALIVMFVLIYLNGTAGEFLPIIAGVCTIMGLMQYIRVKREVESLGRTFTWKL